MSGPPSADEDTFVVGGESDASGDALAHGTQVGRYIVLERLGEGGMGVVVRAYDPKLRREIALKVVRPGTELGGPEARARMLREAQALARLSHPNVVAVYDAESTEHGVCIAMEYVEGRTLRAWLRDEARRWPIVLDVVLAAARGLAAAHTAGIVHRDVKPANVLVGMDGRVRLTDFGLARERQEDAPSSTGATSRQLEGHASDRGSRDSLSRITDFGTVLGTPAYMAPEQHEREIADARTDQYALCVVLWEALYGQRPSRDPHEVLLSPPSSAVPDWVHTPIVRGLAVDPDKRWPSVDALVDALERGQSRAHWRRGIAVVGTLGVAAAALGGWLQLDEQRQMKACERAGESIAEVWNDGTRDRVRTALVGTGVSYAEATADKVMPWLDAQASGWQTARTEACLDARIRGTWDADLLDRALWCLDERRMELEALVTELANAQAGSVGKAVPAAAGLTHVGSCREVDLLERTPSPPKEQREEIRTVRAELSRATALERTGAYDQGLGVASAALSRAEGLEWPPLVAEAHLARGRLLENAGNYEQAEQTLEAAYFAAVEAGAPEIALEAALSLVVTVGDRLARHTEGLRWSRHVAVILASLPDVAQIREGHHLNNLGLIHRAAGSYEQAKALHERVLAIREQAFGPEHPSVAGTLNNLANVHETMGSYAEAKTLYERALAIRKQSLGPEHPVVATGINNLANLHYSMGAFEEAKTQNEQALAIKEKALGPDHPDLAISINSLAGVYYSMGSYEEAKKYYEQAIVLWEKSLGPEHPHIAMSISNLGNVYKAQGQNEEAKALYERALAMQEQVLGPEHADIGRSLNNLANVHQSLGSYEEAKTLHERGLAMREKTLGPEHPHVAMSLENLALVHQAMESYEEARTLLERALIIEEQAFGPEHPDLAYALVGLGNVALAQKRPNDAVPLLERAVTLRENGESPPADVAEARFLLARALQNTKQERPRALALAKQAHDGYRSADKPAQLAKVDAWLVKHGDAR